MNTTCSSKPKLNPHRIAFAVGATFLSIIGCDRPSSTATSSTPTTRVAETQPATAPSAATLPASMPIVAVAPKRSVLMIDGRPVEFPPAKIVLQRKGDTILAKLFSDNPKDALDVDYAGNSFYFEMPLVEDEQQAGLWIWRHRTPGEKADDTPNGVYLRGLKTHLQPFDVLVEVYNARKPRVLVRVVPPSQFRSFEKESSAESYQVMPVSGDLDAEVVSK